LSHLSCAKVTQFPCMFYLKIAQIILFMQNMNFLKTFHALLSLRCWSNSIVTFNTFIFIFDLYRQNEAYKVLCLIYSKKNSKFKKFNEILQLQALYIKIFVTECYRFFLNFYWFWRFILVTQVNSISARCTNHPISHFLLNFFFQNFNDSMEKKIVATMFV